MTPREGRPCAGTHGEAGSGPLNLIHTNNCSNPASMRVPGRFTRLPIALVRKALWSPCLVIPHLPGGPVHWLWLVRLIVTIDTPLRRLKLGGTLYAKSTG